MGSLFGPVTVEQDQQQHQEQKHKTKVGHALKSTVWEVANSSCQANGNSIIWTKPTKIFLWNGYWRQKKSIIPQIGLNVNKN